MESLASSLIVLYFGIGLGVFLLLEAIGGWSDYTYQEWMGEHSAIAEAFLMIFHLALSLIIWPLLILAARSTE